MIRDSVNEAVIYSPAAAVQQFGVDVFCAARIRQDVARKVMDHLVDASLGVPLPAALRPV